MNFNQIKQSILNKEYQPYYILYGNEAYFIDEISSLIENNVLAEAEKSFNQIVLYGKDIDFKTVVDNARQFPMMAERRVVIIKEAQDLRDFEKLQSYFENPSPQCVLVLAYKYKKPDKRKTVWKAAAKNGVLFESKKIYDNQLPQWIDQYLKEEKVTIEPKASMLLAEYLGTNLSKVANELNKLVINVSADKIIRTDDIQNQIGISKDFNVFELQKALGAKDAPRAFRIVDYFAKNEKANPIFTTIPSLVNYFSKLLLVHYNKNLNDFEMMRKAGIPNAFFVKEYKVAASNYSIPQIHKIIGYLFQGDLKSKGVGQRKKNDQGLYQELIYNILNVK